MIIDFGPEKGKNIRNFICPGSFYVALTRVKEGKNVFLKSFDKSYIMVDQKIEMKIDAMRTFNPYPFKKIHVDEEIFEDNKKEIKCGFININGLFDGGHGEYLNEDKNLLNLQFLVLAETKLDTSYKKEDIEKILSNWDVIKRYDADDNKKHMGLMLFAQKGSNFLNKVHKLTYQPAERNGKIQI